MALHRRLAAAALASVLTVGALTACSTASPTATGSAGAVKTLTLAANVELTGANAPIGQTWKKGIELAVDAANSDGGFTVKGQKYQWKLDLRDDKSSPDQAIANIRDWVSQDVTFYAGPGLSSAFLPAFNALAGHPAVVLTPSAAAAQAKPGPGQELFLTANTGVPSTTTAIVDATVKNYKPKTVAILLPQDAAGELYTKTYGTAFAADGVNVVYSKQFPSGTSDFGSYISGIKAVNPDMVVMGYLNTYLEPFINQAISAGLTHTDFVGTFGVDVSGLGSNTKKVGGFSWPVSTRAVDNADDPSMTDFRTAWKAKFGSYPGPDQFQSLAFYDQILALTKAVSEAGTTTDTTKIGDALKKVTSWPHQVMKLHFDPATNTAVYTHQIGVLKGGKITYVETK